MLKATVSIEERFRLTEKFKRSDFWKVVLEPALNTEINMLDFALDGAEGAEKVLAIVRYRAGIRLVRNWIEEWSQPPPLESVTETETDVNY